MTIKTSVSTEMGTAAYKLMKYTKRVKRLTFFYEWHEQLWPMTIKTSVSTETGITAYKLMKYTKRVKGLIFFWE